MLLRIYHRLPGPLRSVAASLRGCYLRSWRYGRETDGLISEALERESWTAQQWQTWREDRLAFVLRRAATRVPYYREQWAKRRREGDKASWDVLENWPILEKEPLRANPLAFVAEDCDVRHMFSENTSGTSGKPLTLWWSRATVRQWFALFEARLRSWNGVSRHERWAILGGQPVTPTTAQRPPFWVWNPPMNQLYLSANHLSPRHAQAYVSALEKYQVTHLIGYASSAAVLAREIMEANLEFSGLRAVITNAEPLLPWQRETIQRGLKTVVRESYGMAEAVAAASECAAGHLHLWPEVGHVEVLQDEENFPALDGSVGRLVCTGLLNADMPLIRYAVGDRGSFSVQSSECSCGRTLPIVAGIEGRTNDMLISPDGRRVYWLNPVFYGLPVKEAQIVQESMNQLRVNYVPSLEFTMETSRIICERLKDRMGAVEVTLEPVSCIPRGPNGKFRAVINRLPPDQTHRVDPIHHG